MTDGAAMISTARGQVYDLLVTVFRRPLDADRLERLRAPEMLAAMEAASVDPGDDFVKGNGETVLDELAIDYTHLFNDPVERIAPYEGIQCGDGKDLMGPGADAVRRFMAEVGFSVPPESGELPDHISVELEFMQQVTLAEEKAWKEGDTDLARVCLENEKKFIEEHLVDWIPDFCDKVINEAELPFYRMVAELTKKFIVFEKNEVGRSDENCK